MVVMGLGLGIAMSAFTVIVQNQYPRHRLGEVTAGLQFFRSIGSTVGLAVFGTILNNQFAAAMKTNLPAQLSQAMAKRGASIDNPQVLLSEQARVDALQHAFAQFGAQGDKMFTVFMDAVRQSLSSAIDGLFLLAALLGVIGLIVVLFLREDPLRKTHHIDAESGELDSEAGYEPDPEPETEGEKTHAPHRGWGGLRLISTGFRWAEGAPAPAPGALLAAPGRASPAAADQTGDAAGGPAAEPPGEAASRASSMGSPSL